MQEGADLWFCLSGMDGAGKSSLADHLSVTGLAGSDQVDITRPKYTNNELMKEAAYRELGREHAYLELLGAHSYLTGLSLDWVCWSRENKSLLESGEVAVITDRGPVDLLAQAFSYGLPERAINWALSMMPRPEATVFLDVPVQIADARLVDRGVRHELESLPNLVQLADALDRSISSVERDGHFVHRLDGNAVFSKVADECVRFLNSRLATRS